MRETFLTILIIILISIGTVGILIQSSKKEALSLPQYAMLSEKKKASEETELSQKMEELLKMKYKEDVVNMKVRVTMIEGNYAKGEVSVDGGGGLWFAVKRNNEWILVWDGNGIIQCSDLTGYSDFSSSIIPACFDKGSEKLINR